MDRHSRSKTSHISRNQLKRLPINNLGMRKWLSMALANRQESQNILKDESETGISPKADLITDVKCMTKSFVPKR